VQLEESIKKFHSLYTAMTPTNKQHLVAPRSHISQEMRENRRSHKGMVFWLTGLSGSGKSTLAHEAEFLLFENGYEIVVLDGDVIRKGLCRDLDFSAEHRRENIRRIAEVAKILVRNGTLCLCAFISPSEESRQCAKNVIGAEYFREIYISCSLQECERRDPKSFYQKARQGKIANYTGVSSAYDPPVSPDCVICTENQTIPFNTQELLAYIISQARK